MTSKKTTEPTRENFSEVLEKLRQCEFGCLNGTLDRLDAMLKQGDPEPDILKQLYNSVNAVADLCNGVTVSNKAANLRMLLKSKIKNGG